MIIYFADRQMNIKGQASSRLRKGFKILDDIKIEDVESGVASFECRIGYEKEDRAALEEMVNAGNYLLRSHENENEFYTIIDCELDTKKQEVYIYAEDAGLDLLNEIAGAFEADKAYPITSYINKWINDSGFEIGKNEVPSSSSRKLKWEGESTVTERLASIATQFGNYEISYSFEIKGLFVTRKLVNIHKKRGKDTGEQLRLNKEVDRIITKKSVANIATAFSCTGGTPENSETPITLKGYKYDDGDFYVGTDGILRSRKANKKWSRYIWNKEPNKKTNAAGYICKSYSYDTLSQATLCAHAITELKKVCDMEINFEIDIKKLPEGVKIGDRVNVIDDAGELYLYTRLLQLKTSVTKKEKTATLGEHLIKNGGISQKVIDLAEQFAKMTVSVSRATAIAENAKGIAEGAANQAMEARNEAFEALDVAVEAQTAANTATQSAASAEALAQAAQAAVDKVEESVSSLETTVTEAQNAANNAQQAATTATQKAEEAETAANNAVKDASEAKTAAGVAQNSAASAISKADEAIDTANTAKSEAEEASDIAAAAKLDAEQAEQDVEAFGESLETFRQTVSAEYSRKTDLTETEATLQAQITANANQLTVTHNKVVEVDETANNAASLAQQAQNTAASAQSKADQATADAEAAQTAADEAKAAAQSAQSEADTAKAAAATAQSVADKAKTDLEAAQAELATVQGRVNATEEEIAAAQQAVETAQAAADKAQEDADTAAQQAATAQSVANTAAENATNAQTVADNAASQASLAQQVANEAKGNAEQAQTIANQAAAKATEAQNTANTAKTNAENAQSVANQAASNAAAAQQAADDAEAKAQQAANDLATAQQNLADVTERVDATEEEVAAAQAAVETAQAAADLAKSNAATAQATADTAKANAATAQTAANNAKTAADNAQAAADEAQAAANKAQEAVNALAVRVTEAETNITKTATKIELEAYKKEVTTTLGGYSTKAETAAAIKVESDKINSSVKKQVEEIQIGGRNLLTNSDVVITKEAGAVQAEFVQYADLAPIFDEHGLIEYTLSFDLKSADTTNKNVINVYCQNGSASKYAIGTTPITVTTEYKRYSIVFTPSLYVETETKSMLAFYGTYDTGNIPCVKNVKLEKGNRATDWTPAPEDVSSDIDKVTESATDALTRLEAAETQIQQLADNISMLVQKGDKSSRMVFDEESSTWSFDTKEIDENITQHTTDIEDLKNGAGETAANVEKLNNRFDNFEEHISITTYEDEPCLMLYENDSNYKQRVTNTRRIITEEVNGEEVIKSEVGIDTARYKKVVAEETSQIGGFAWKKRGTNRIGLVWEGAIK